MSYMAWVRSLVFFFFQAEDGIRDSSVTGVQTCALPIYSSRAGGQDKQLDQGVFGTPRLAGTHGVTVDHRFQPIGRVTQNTIKIDRFEIRLAWANRKARLVDVKIEEGGRQT